MKGTENIIAHIKADAQAKADGIIAEAEKQCAQIKADYENRANDAYAEKIRKGVKDREDITESRERIAHMEAKKELLSLKQEMVSAGFEKAREMILNLPEEKYLEFLTNITVKSSSAGDEQLILNAADREKFGAALLERANEALNGKLTLSETVGDFDGGVVLKRGAVEVNSTLSLLVELARNGMAAELAAVLFG